MSVYYKEKPEYLQEAMNSIWKQTIPTNDFVLICDGPLTDALDAIVEEMQIKHIAITIVVMLLIFIHSAMPGDLSSAESGIFAQIIARLTGLDPQPLQLIVRKAAHFTEFMILGICLLVNVRDRMITEAGELGGGRMYLIAWLMGTAYAVTDEVHQIFVPDRACALMDMCIDSAGVAAGAVLIVILSTVRNKLE